ncbi:unnamed protein product [Tilletia controversa]|nr:unnamed protein product [Tilletia controversa]
MKTSTVVSVSAATLVSAGVAYAFYFDYRRRNDPAYRKNLRAQQKKAAAATGAADPSSSSSTTSASIPRTPAEKAAALERAYAEVKRAQKEEAPKDFAQLRTYFDRHVALGEELSSKGPAAQYDAAVAFMKALGVYVEPLELLEIYSKALSKEIYAIVMELIAKDMIENTAGAASAAAVSEMAAGGGASASAGGPAGRSAELNSIDGDVAGPTAATPAPATATASTTAPTDTVENPSADTSAPAPVPATEPTATTPTPDSDHTAPTSSSQTANSSSDEMLGSTTGPASTTSSQEWDAISASSAIGHTPVTTGTSAPAPAPAPVEAEVDEATPAPTAVEESAPIETTMVEPVTEPVPEPESTAPAEEEEEDSSFIYAPSTPAPAPAPAPEPTASHPAEPVLSQVDVVGEQDDDDEAQQDEAEATATSAVELEELEPDAVGESVADPPEVAPPAPAPAAPADVFSSFENVPPPVFSGVSPEREEAEEEEEEEDDDEEEGEVATASTTGSWASVQPVGSMPKSPSGGNRDSPRWS